MNILRGEPSFGNEFTAAWTLVNSPDAAPLGLTTTAPYGGDVIDARLRRVGPAMIFDANRRKEKNMEETVTLEPSIFD